MALDFSDKAIRAMVDINHKPEETWTSNGTMVPYLDHVRCGMCRQDWPCPTVRALRKYRADNPSIPTTTRRKP